MSVGNKNLPWLQALQQISAASEPYVLITILGARGSTPRDSGTKMVVTQEHTYDTIGGGHLEYKAIQQAREFLLQSESVQHLEHYPLGAELGQCCGGSISVLFESFLPSQVNLMVFGAGHVGQALMAILADLPVRVRWVDSREAQFPEHLPANVEAVPSDYPVDEIDQMPPGAYYLIITHNHQLDFELCEALLKKNDFGYLGLIGSDTKWARFQKRFDHKGFSPEQVNNITCPVGLSQVPGKRPMEVAVSIAGEIIQHYQALTPETPTQQGLHWNTLKDALGQTQTRSTSSSTASTKEQFSQKQGNEPAPISNQDPTQ